MLKHVATSLIAAALSASILFAQEPPAPAVTEKKSLSPESFQALRNVQDPQFSPDGSRVAFVVSDPLTGEKRTRHIWLYDKATNNVRQLTFSVKSETSPRWSPDGKFLAFLSNRGDEQQIYLLPMTGGEGVALTKGKAGVTAFAWSPDRKSIAYLAPEPQSEAEEKKEKDKDDARVVDKDDKQPRLRILDVATKNTRAITPGNWKIESLEWMPDGQSLVVEATSKPTSDQFVNGIYRAWLRGGMDELRPPHGPVGDIKVSPDGKLIAFAGARDDGPDPHDLWVLNAEGGAARNLTGASLDGAIENFRWGKDGLLYVAYAEGFRNRIASYSLSAERKDLSEFPVNPGEFGVSSGGEIAFAGQTSVAPPELWLRNAQGEARQVTHFNDALQSLGLIAPEFYKYKSFDGVEVEAALLRPAGYGGKSKLPTVFLIPIGQSQELYRGLKRYGVETELVLYPREPHGFQELKHRVDVLNRMLGWFDKYLKQVK
jgi:dipeptidyl aminopeptidase/acylaminoacyl peptidase